jgi:hypothetical protein
VGDSEEDEDRMQGATVDHLGRTLQKGMGTMGLAFFLFSHFVSFSFFLSSFFLLTCLGEVTRKEATTIVEGIKETLKEIVEGIYSKLSASEQESETESTVDAKGLTVCEPD